MSEKPTESTDQSRSRMSAIPGLGPGSPTPPPPPARQERGRGARQLRSAPEPAPETGKPQPEPAPGPRRSQQPGAAATTAAQPVTISLPPTIVDALRAKAHADHTPHADVLMDAIVANADQLSTLVTAYQTNLAQRARTSDGLFTRATAKPAPPQTALPLRMRPENVAVLDRLTREHEAASRSQLCAAALEAYLT